MTNEKNMTMETVSTPRVPQSTPGFDPMKFAKEAVDKAGKKVLTLELKHKKNWFRLACPNGGVVLNPLRVTDQMAIFEARLFADTDDRNPLASFTATRSADKATGGQYIRAAQEDALNEALENAGFSLQLHQALQARQAETARKVPAEVPKENVPAVTAPKQTVGPQQAVFKVNPPAVETKPAADTVPHSAPVNVAPQVSPRPTPVNAAPQVSPRPAPVNVVPQASVQSRPEPVGPQPRRTERLPQEKKEPVPAVVDISTAKAKEMEAQPAVQDENTQMSLGAGSTPPAYTADMTVDEICRVMTLDEAKAIKVQEGTCKGWTLEQVAKDRPASLKWLQFACTFADNVLKAGAKLVLADLELKMAG